jgi:endonuclease/exonuclease/phosphatase family metal-dependent hydrolase
MIIFSHRASFLGLFQVFLLLILSKKAHAFSSRDVVDSPSSTRRSDQSLGLQSTVSSTGISLVSDVPSQQYLDEKASINAILPPPYPSFQTDPHPFATAPVGSFLNTTNGQLSVASLNLLAPFYHALSLNYSSLLSSDDRDDEDKKQQVKESFLKQDRLERVPMAVRMAKQTNADILLLQEIEGSSSHDLEQPSNVLNHGLSTQMEALLAQDEEYQIPDSDSKTLSQTLHIQGYDSYVWTSLMPNNKWGDPVGLCVAWRSQRHSMIAWEGFKRGMACQFQEVMNPGPSHLQNDASTFAIANLHLPARPSNILGRLKTMSRTVRKLHQMDQNKKPLRKISASTHHHLDGLVIVGGDFNCDQNSVAAQLLKRGSSSYGNLRDRNYKTKLTKASALEMRHPYFFLDVYESSEDGKQPFRDKCAPATVSLKGRGPGCMDHLFFATATNENRNQAKNAKPFASNMRIAPARVQIDSGKRSQRRKKAEMRQQVYLQTGSDRQSNCCQNYPSTVQLRSILGTIQGSSDKGRLEHIAEGLPNVKCGFPSDHLPIGAMFVGTSRRQSSVPAFDDGTANLTDAQRTSVFDPSTSNEMKNGVSTSVQRRRQSSRASFGLRRRHNAVLNAVNDWVVARGLDGVVRDQPLYKNELLTPDGILNGLKRKSRAPDLMGIVRQTISLREQGSVPGLVLIEVAVASDPDRVKMQKLSKYSDIVDLLSSSSIFSRCDLFSLIFHDDGTIPIDTRHDIECLAAVLNPSGSLDLKPDVDSFCSDLQSILSRHG